MHNYLKQECSAGRFYKSGTKYVVDSLVTFDDWSIFADYITRLQYFAMFNGLPVDNYLQQNFNDDALEDVLFKFSSRLGALISYIIIEALRPTEHLKLQRHRQQIAVCYTGSLIMLITYSSLVPECGGVLHCAAGQLLIDRHTKIVINPTTQKPSYYRIIKKRGCNFYNYLVRIKNSIKNAKNHGL